MKATAAAVHQACVGKQSCGFAVESYEFGPYGTDPCPGTPKALAVGLEGNCSAAAPGTLACQLSGYARDYALANCTQCSYYQRLQPRNDTRPAQAVQYALDVPTGNVTIHSGVLLDAFWGGIAYLLDTYTVDDLLFNFRRRAGKPNP
eukprot:gene3721-4133_t